MDERICFSKRNSFIVMVLLFIVSLVYLSTLTLQSNQAKNSRAADENSKQAEILPQALPPTMSQQSDPSIQFKATIDSEKKVQFLGAAPSINESSVYAIYFQKRDGTLIYVDTFRATQTLVNSLFTTYWSPGINASPLDIKNGTFYLFQVN